MRVKKVRRTHAHTNILIIISPLKYWHTLQFLSNYYPFSTSYVSFLLLDQICSLMLQSCVTGSHLILIHQMAAR